VRAAALAGPPPPHPPRPPDLLLQGLAVRFTNGYAAGAPILKEALRAFEREAVLPPEEARWLWFASQIAVYFHEAVEPYGSFAKQALVVEDQLLTVPDGLTDEQTIPLGIAGLTA
jgi:hypothetical protein